MQRKHFLGTILVMSSTLALITMSVIGLNVTNVAKKSARASGYSFALNSLNAPDTYGEDVDVVATELGNPITLNYVGASASSGNHAAFTAGGYMQNVKEILDLQSLVINGTGSFKLHTGFEAYTNVVSFELNDEERLFNLSNTSYFKLEAVTSSVVKTLSGEFLCSETSLPALTGGQTSDPVYDTRNWNRLVHDVDTSKDFTYSVTFYEKTSEATRTSRPSFFVFPSAYNEDDSIVSTGENDYFFNGGTYYKIRQDNYQCCQQSGSKTEIAMSNANRWFNDNVTIKANSEGGFIGGGSTPMARITRDCKVEVIFKLENKVSELDVAYQEWTITMLFDSVSKVSDTDYSGHYEQVYKATSSSGNIFPCERIGIAMAINNSWSGTFTLLDSSSENVR